MRVPEIRRHLTRGDLAVLATEICRLDRVEGRKAREAVSRGEIDSVLDSEGLFITSVYHIRSKRSSKEISRSANCLQSTGKVIE